MDNYFIELNSIDLSDKTEEKNGMKYLSWAWAWGEVKKLHPTANYKIYENINGFNYHTDGKTAWVKTGVTINDIEHIEYLPVMDFRNKSIEIDKITSFDVNKAIQRSLTKAVARHGLGLYIYAGEDLPEDITNNSTPKEQKISIEQIKTINEMCKLTNTDVAEIINYVNANTNKSYSDISQFNGNETGIVLQILNKKCKKSA